MRHHGANGGPAASAAAVPPRGSEKAEGRPTAKSREPSSKGTAVQNFANSIFNFPKFQGTVRTTGGKRQAMARGDDEAGGSGAGRGTAKRRITQGGEGRGNKPPINRFQGYHRTEMLWSKGPGMHFLVICDPGARPITSCFDWRSGVWAEWDEVPPKSSGVQSGVWGGTAA